MINNISSVAYRINSDVLDFIITNDKKYNLLLDTGKEHPLELKRRKEKLSVKETKELDSYLTTKLLQDNILGIALLYRDIPSIYFPVRIDNRGRIYCETDFLNYQSTGLAKSLLLFSSPEKVCKSDQISINYLKIYGANCFGNKIDKASFKDRIA
jgi:DNA-directed RNA polymerase